VTLDHRATLGIGAAIGDVWDELSLEYPGLPTVAFVPAPVTVSAVLELGPIAPLTASRWLVVLPARGDAYDVLHITLHAAALLLTYGAGRPAFTTKGRASSAFAAWASMLTLSVAYEHRLGFGATSLSASTARRFWLPLSKLRTILELSESRSGDTFGDPAVLGSS
jgi:hypothetical protein